MILQDQGALNVDDNICNYITECPVNWGKITLHHLLTHISGIPNFTDFDDYEETDDFPTTPLETIARFAPLELDFTPGSQWEYSNSGYIILGYIIEQVSGQTYDAFIKENIFEPLQMMDSGYDHNLEDIAKGYAGHGTAWRDADYVDMSIPYAAGALYSTVEDMYLWDQALYSTTLIPQNILDSIFTSYTETPIGGYGYGWFLGKKHTQRAIWHGGGGDGFVTMIERFPVSKSTIIVLCNRETTDIRAIRDEIGKMLFE